MTVLKNNAGIEPLSDSLLADEQQGRLPRMDYTKGAPDFSAFMSGGWADKNRMDAEFAALFLQSSDQENTK